MTRSGDQQTSRWSDSKLIPQCSPPRQIRAAHQRSRQPTVAFKVSSFGAAVTETILIGSDIYKISRVIAVPRQTVRDISTSLLDN